MKKTGKCPKCGSTEIYTDETISTGAVRGTITISAIRTAKTVNYVCLSYGYIERYLKKIDVKDKEKIRSKWKMRGE